MCPAATSRAPRGLRCSSTSQTAHPPTHPPTRPPTHPPIHPRTQAGLTQSLALIQGPPGTGKTHLGLQLMRVLWRNLPPGTPVLCVCYTNHALDQFLEGVLEAGLADAPGEVVRIGSK